VALNKLIKCDLSVIGEREVGKEKGVANLYKKTYYWLMFPKVSKLILLSFIFSVLPSNTQVANSTDILWNPAVSNDLNNAGPGLVPGAGIRTTGLLVNKSNPDELIMQIIMNDSFEDKPFSGKGRNMAMWIYWPSNYCWSKDKANCQGLFTVGEPYNPATYPSAKSSEYIFVDKHEKASNVNVKATTCKAPWWIESTFKSRDTWAFAVSITCLGMPKEFGWYAFSQIDIGQKDVVSDFTQVQTITYPFHDLAASAAEKNKNTNSKQVCVLATTGKGYKKVIDLEEQCSDSDSQWEFSYCESHTKSDLELFRNKKWIKVSTVKSSKGDCDDPSEPNSFTYNGPLLGKYRIKYYGNNKFAPAYLNLVIYKKDIA